MIEPGAVSPGDRITVESRPDHDVTVELAFRAVTTSPELLPRLLVADAFPAKEMAKIRQSFAERLWNVGQIALSSAAEHEEEIVIRNVPDPEKVRRVIDLYRQL